MGKLQFQEMRLEELNNENNNTEYQTQWDLHEKINLVPLEFTEENKPELFGIEPIKAQEMVKGLSVTIAERQVLKDAYIDVIQLEVNAENLPTFKEFRLKFVKIRTSIDKWHKSNKAFYLAGGRFVDAIKNKEIAETEEIEAKLMEAEKFFENQQKQKAKELNNLRISKISPYVENADQMDFKEFSDEDFEDFVFGKKVKQEQRIADEKAEAERVESERIEREKEIEAQRIENAKLKAEAEAREVQAQAEQKERIETAEKLAKEPIKKQMIAWVETFTYGLPLENETSILILAKFESFKKWAKSEINKL